MVSDETPRSPLADLLSLLRLPPADTTLLRACLLQGERGQAALESWARSGTAVDLLPPRCNRLFPLLAEAARRFETPLEPIVRSRLRAAMASEEVRYEAYLQVLRPALATLGEDGIEVILLKGAALAETVYPRPQLRHSHDVDLLVTTEQHASAVDCLRRRGWQAAAIAPAGATQTLVHPSGLPLCLHTRLIRGALHPADFRTLRPRTKAVSVAGMDTMTLSPADALFHILGQAVSSGSFTSLLWACDAFFCIDRGGIDWEVFISELRRTELSPVYVDLLRYLHAELGVDLLTAVVTMPAQQSAQVTWRQSEAAVASLHIGAFGLRKMWDRSRTWPTRLALLKWLLLPGSDMAQAIAPGVPRWRLPLRHLGRAAARMRARAQARRAS